MLLIYSGLQITPKDRAWIDGLRRSYDPQHPLIEPHFTFVFPFDGLAVVDVATHAREIATATPAIPFRLSAATAVRDAFSPTSRLFLLPTEGDGPLRALHARLYGGPLAPMLNRGIPFEPHVTVGAFERHEDAQRAAATAGAFDIHGRLDAVRLASFDGAKLTPLHKFALDG